MNLLVSTVAIRRIAAAAGIALLALLPLGTASSQGISATAAVTKPKAGMDVNTLQKQMQALEQRILELEKDALDEINDDSEAEAAATRLEKRLASSEASARNLERRLAGLENGADSAGTTGGDNDKPMTVTAPFLVVDRAGKPLMRVGEAEDSFSRGMYVFNANGRSVAHVGVASDGNGRLYAATPGGIPAAQIGAEAEGGIVLISNTSAQAVMLNKEALHFFGDSKAQVAVFGTKNRAKGYLELNDSAGNKMVEAGMLNSQKGYVMASPYRATVDPRGDPSVIRGAGK